MSKICLLILGMHGSGSGTFSRLLGLHGAKVPRTPLTAIGDNNVAQTDPITSLNDMLLAACGRRWDDWRGADIGDGAGARAAELVTLIAGTIGSEYGGADRIVLDDPRISRLVPLYVEALDELGYAVEFLHVLRDPGAVAGFLAARNGIPAEQACRLWMHHHLDAELATRGGRRGFFSHDELMEDWRPVVARMRSLFSLPIDDAMAGDAAIEAALIEESPWLPGCAPPEGLGEALAGPIDEVSRLLGRLRGEPDDREAMQRLDTIRRTSLCQRSGHREMAERDEGGPAFEIEAPQAGTAQLLARLELGSRLDELRDSSLRGLRAEVENEKLAAELATNKAARTADFARMLDRALCNTRKRPYLEFGKLMEFRLLRVLARDQSPLPDALKRRFRQSAAKVDPMRSWRDPRHAEMLSVLMTPPKPRTPADPAGASIQPSQREADRAAAERDLTAFLATNASITLPPVERPRVSIILVLWNQAGLTLRCLRSLAAEADLPFELIVVDNGSTDRTSRLLRRIDNARLLPQAENLGFLEGVNRGLEAVRGGHVLLLNNDAVLRPGALAAAVETMEAGADTGAVGGMIILPDGTLQEAGSIIWADGRCSGYGRGDDPRDGAYNFRREVDYCSGAFLLIREGLFQQLGGFDTDFAPAYYEDTDLCMRIRAAGFKVVFEPRAVIDHFEFASAETAERSIEMQKTNQHKFAAKHSGPLRDHLDYAQSAILAARLRGHRERILYIEDAIPVASFGAGLPRSNTILRLMVEEGYFVTFFPTVIPDFSWDTVRSNMPADVEVTTRCGLPGLERFLEERRGYYRQIFVSRPHNMKALADIHARRPELFEGLKITYDAEAMFSARDEIKAAVLGDAALADRASAEKLRELALVEIADQITAVSEAEAAVFRRASGKPTRVLGHAPDIEPTTALFDERTDTLFVGRLEGDDSPNVDSLVWFSDKVMPFLDGRPASPASLKVVGRNDASRIRALDPARVELLGAIDDLRPVFNAARVFIAPTRFAAGIPLKVLYAAAHGVPVVATSLLASQLGWSHEEELLVADTPEGFAEAVDRLHRNSALWERLRTKALHRIGQDCSITDFQAVLREILAANARPGA